MSGGPMKPPPRPAPDLANHAFLRADDGLIVGITHVRAVRRGEQHICIYTTSGKEFYLKYSKPDEARDAFEKIWGQIEHLRLPLEG